ncbi:YcnI family protein [Sphaerobacter sp.]|uniref:YcnI family copper-binding membrane protein n=1 Tax=Sphaerobacter sp. TaxID=2099654 RepID=UPI001DE61FC2|nr:YcnI family protein [Sphaerobacter sp.]MBX5445260.1 YcnI family protein [Sphaerobacter sp.]
MIKRTVVAAVIGVTMLLVMTGVASAHVTVWPREATAGSFEKYTVRVPTEKDIPTVKVELIFPQGLRVSSFQPKPGWTYEVQRDAAGNITGVIWSGGSIGPGEFDEFAFVAANPQEPGELVFVAHQTYADGSVVSWEGPPGSENPASVTTIVAGSADTSGHADAAPANEGAGAGDSDGATASDSGSGPLGETGTFWLAVAALGVGVVGVVLSVTRLRRPS